MSEVTRNWTVIMSCTPAASLEQSVSGNAMWLFWDAAIRPALPPAGATDAVPGGRYRSTTILKPP